MIPSTFAVHVPNNVHTATKHLPRVNSPDQWISQEIPHSKKRDCAYTSIIYVNHLSIVASYTHVCTTKNKYNSMVPVYIANIYIALHFVFCISYHIIKNGTWYIYKFTWIHIHQENRKMWTGLFLQNPAGFLWTLLHHHLRFGSSSFEVRPGHHTEGARDQPSFEITNARHLRLAAPEEKPTRFLTKLKRCESECLCGYVLHT